METFELYDVVSRYYGYKIRNMYMDESKKEVGGLLYDSFFLRCNVNQRYGCFGGGIKFTTEYCVYRSFLNKGCTTGGNQNSINISLKNIDDYCIARLPNKFIEAYNNAYLPVKHRCKLGSYKLGNRCLLNKIRYFFNEIGNSKLK